MKKVINILVIIVLIGVIAMAISNCPFVKGKQTGACPFFSWLKLPCWSGDKAGLELKRGELYSKGGKWHVPYDVVSGARVVFSGEIISDDVIAPYLAGVKGGDILIKYRGADLAPVEVEDPKEKEAAEK